MSRENYVTREEMNKFLTGEDGHLAFLQRIIDHKVSDEDLHAIGLNREDFKDEDELYEAIEENTQPLGMTKSTVINIQTSWGGPADGFEIKISNEGEVMNGVYYRADWGEYEEYELTGEEAEIVFDAYKARYFFEY